MRAKFLTATSALVLAMTPAGIGPIAIGAATGALVMSTAGVVASQDLESATAAVAAAKAALEDAKAKGEGVKQARQALKAARQERKRLVEEAKADKQQPDTEQAADAATQERPSAEADAANAAADAKPEAEAEAATAEKPQDKAAQKPAAEQAAEEQSVEDKPAADVAESEQPVSREADAQEAKPEEAERKKRAKAKSDDRKAARQAKREKRKQASEAETPVVAKTDADKPKDETPVAGSEQPAPSADAPKAKPVAEAPIEKQIEEASEKPASVVPDSISKAERRQLRRAEKQRREAARQQRGELLGAAGVGAVIGALIPALGGKVIGDEGDRIVVERDGRFYVRKDESALFRDRGQRVERESLKNGRTRETVHRRNGSKIITVRDPGGYALRRVKVKPNGERIVLFNAKDDRERRSVNYDRQLPPVRITIPRDQYIVSGTRYGRAELAQILEAPPVEQVTSDYSLREVRESERLRATVRRVDLDAITFDTGSATVRASQVPYLANVAGGMLDVIDRNPAAVFLIEGHTDAVGDDVYNLTLSDRRAETVARILVNAFEVPPENLVVEGYGEQYLKIDTEGDERRNRRVAIRNITPLLTASAN